MNETAARSTSRIFDPSDPFFSVSVIVPFYKGARFIHETLESILSQTVRPSEVIVIDDGSPDPFRCEKTWEGRIKLVRRTNQGASAARNWGASIASGRWVAFCDQDDLWLPTKLERQLRLIAEVPELHYVLTDHAPTYDGSTALRSHLSYAPEGFWMKEEHESGFVVREPVAGKLSGFQPGITSTPIVLREFFLERGQFDVDVAWGAEDTCFHFRCLSVTPFGVVPEVLMLYRRHPQAGSADEFLQLKKTVDVWKYIADNYPEARPYRENLLAGLGPLREEIRRSARYARRQKLKRLLGIR